MKTKTMTVLLALFLCAVTFTACGTKPELKAKQQSEKRTKAIYRDLDNAFPGMEIQLQLLANVSLNEDQTVQIREIIIKPGKPSSQGAILTMELLDVEDVAFRERLKEVKADEVISVKIVRRGNKLVFLGFETLLEKG